MHFILTFYNIELFNMHHLLSVSQCCTVNTKGNYFGLI